MADSGRRGFEPAPDQRRETRQPAGPTPAAMQHFCCITPLPPLAKTAHKPEPENGLRAPAQEGHNPAIGA